MDNHHKQFLRHTLATLAYRGGKVLRGAPETFSGFRAADSSRSAGQVLAHICDLLDWALSIANGKESWHDSTPQPWDEDVKRFHTALIAFDLFLESDRPLPISSEKLFQGPVADALTHVGQIAMLRRLASCPVKGENYFRAQIVAGRLGSDQAAPVREFD